MNKQIKVLIVEPGKAPVLTKVPNSLLSLQHIVGGYIETVTIAKDVVIICNEETRTSSTLLFNLRFCGIPLFGTFIVAGVKRDSFCSLTKKNADFCANEFCFGGVK